MISSPETAKYASRSPYYAQRADDAPQPEQEGVHCDEKLPCFGSSAVYHCTKNSCSEFQGCVQAVSPWLPG